MNKIKHLYWRAGFGLSPAEWQERKDWRVDRAVEELFGKASAAGALTVESRQKPDLQQMGRGDLDGVRKEERRLVARQNIEWILRMADPERSALMERMSLFWHGHFACRVLESRASSDYLQVLRTHGLGKFRDLILGVARSAAMIRYLNNQQNRKEKPNENFARELLELFTIGRGHYEERDIKEAARAFTGWSSNLQGDYVFRAFQHDYGSKQFFGKTGNFDGADIIDFILERRETAGFIAGKIYRFFVNEQPDPEIVQELATRFYDSDYDIGRLMRDIFTSDWFYEARNAGNKIKGPVELIAGLLRAVSIHIEPGLALLPLQKGLGQMLFNPPNVAGWPGGQSWIDNSTLLLRLNLASYFFNNTEIPFRAKAELAEEDTDERPGMVRIQVDWQPLAGLLKKKDPAAAAQTLSDFLLTCPSPVEPAVWEQVAAGAGGDDEVLKRLASAVLSLPEYQLC